MRRIWIKRERSDINYEDRSKCKDIQIRTILFHILCLRKWNMVHLITPFSFEKNYWIIRVLLYANAAYLDGRGKEGSKVV